jgi:hypothetical protein
LKRFPLDAAALLPMPLALVPLVPVLDPAVPAVDPLLLVPELLPDAMPPDAPPVTISALVNTNSSLPDVPAL